MPFSKEEIKEINKIIDERLTKLSVYSTLGDKYIFPIFKRFDVPKSGFNSHLIYTFSMLSFMAYHDKNEIIRILDLFDSDWIINNRFEFHADSNPQFFVLSNLENIIIIFRGFDVKNSNTAIKSLLQNTRLNLTEFEPYGIGKVHSIFKNELYKGLGSNKKLFGQE